MSIRPVLTLTIGIACVAGASALVAATVLRGSGAPEAEKVFLSKTYEVDRKYRSMMGPWSKDQLYLVDGGEPELLWITGYHAVMVGADGESPMAQEFMCHSNLDLDPEVHRELLGYDKILSGRLFTLSQGQLDIELPEGFGIPILSTQPLDLTTQVLNLNHEAPDAQVRHKVTVRYVRDRDRDRARPMKPLFQQGIYALATLEEGPTHFGIPEEHDRAQGPGCMVGSNAAAHEYKDGLGRRFTGHWVVPPGRQVNRTQVTAILNLPFDTTLHYIAVHLHPFAESLELKDLTADETVFRSRVRPAAKGIGIDHVEHFTSVEGVPLYRDHDYELVSVYNNTSNEDQDSMAVMYMYFLDHEVDPTRLAFSGGQ